VYEGEYVGGREGFDVGIGVGNAVGLVGLDVGKRVGAYCR